MFRQQVIEAKQQKMLGTVTITQPLPIYLYCFVLFLVFLLVLIYLMQSSYSRKETVKGYVVPEKGLVKVFSNRTGIIKELYVIEGERIQKGDNIAKIQNSQTLSSGIELSFALSTELSVQINTLEQEYEAITKMYQKELIGIQLQIKQLNKTLSVIEKVKKTSLKKLDLKKKTFTDNERLHKRGYLSNSELERLQGELFEYLESHERLKKELTNIQVEISILDSKRLVLPEQQMLKQASIKRKISELTARRKELNNQYEFIHKAPEAGLVTAIHPTVGTRVSVETPLLSIIPFDSPLEVEMLLPSRSAGFVKNGDKVNIRFDAFPYQKFGTVSGEVIKVDKALILPSDKILPINISEAMYRVRARLDQQSINAYGKSFPIKIGMIVDADIILDERSVLDWLLEPIYAISGRLK